MGFHNPRCKDDCILAAVHISHNPPCILSEDFDRTIVGNMKNRMSLPSNARCPTKMLRGRYVLALKYGLLIWALTCFLLVWAGFAVWALVWYMV